MFRYIPLCVVKTIFSLESADSSIWMYESLISYFVKTSPLIQIFNYPINSLYWVSLICTPPVSAYLNITILPWYIHNWRYKLPCFSNFFYNAFCCKFIPFSFSFTRKWYGNCQNGWIAGWMFSLMDFSSVIIFQHLCTDLKNYKYIFFITTLSVTLLRFVSKHSKLYWSLVFMKSLGSLFKYKKSSEPQRLFTQTFILKLHVIVSGLVLP